MNRKKADERDRLISKRGDGLTKIKKLSGALQILASL
jgi:hypothetical protein